MNGISSTLKDEIKKSKDVKQKEKFKLVACLLITNVLVAMLCLPSPGTEQISDSVKKTLHANHQMMAIPMTVLITETKQDSPETPVTLVSKDQKIIAEKAFLHEEIKNKAEMANFKIEINNLDVVKVSEFLESGVIALPYVENKKNKVSRLPSPGSKYEISL